MVIMITEIGEEISVTAVFGKGGLRPVGFIWRGRRYRVTCIFGSHRDRAGNFTRFHYAVGIESGDVFEIVLDTEKMSWQLKKIHSEG